MLSATCVSLHSSIWQDMARYVNVIGPLGNSAAGRVLSCVAIPRGQKVKLWRETGRSWIWKMEFPGSLNRWDRWYIITQVAVYKSVNWELDSRQQTVAWSIPMTWPILFQLRRKLWGAVSLLEEKPRLGMYIYLSIGWLDKHGKTHPKKTKKVLNFQLENMKISHNKGT